MKQALHSLTSLVPPYVLFLVGLAGTVGLAVAQILAMMPEVA